MSSETAREAGLPYPAPNKDSLLSPCLEGQGSYARDDKAGWDGVEYLTKTK